MKFFLVVLLVFVFSLSSFAQSDRDRAIDLYRQGSYQECIDLLEKLRETGDADYPAATYLGAAYLKSGDNARAIEIFGKAHSFKKPDILLKYDKKLEITNKPRPVFSEKAMGNSATGIVRLAIEFKADGSLGFIFPFAASADTLVEEAVNAASRIRFKPAVREGKPVSVVSVFEYSFAR